MHELQSQSMVTYSRLSHCILVFGISSIMGGVRMKRKLVPLGVTQSDSGAHFGTFYAWEVQTPYPILRTLYEPNKRLRNVDEMKLLRRTISLAQENRKLRSENEALRQLLMGKRAQ